MVRRFLLLMLLVAMAGPVAAQPQQTERAERYVGTTQMVAGDDPVTFDTISPMVIIGMPVLDVGTVLAADGAGHIGFIPEQPGGTFFAAPSAGGGAPSFRAIVKLDLVGLGIAFTGDPNIFSVPQTIRSTTSPQLTVGYDTNAKLTMGVSSAGQVTFAIPGGGSPSFTFTSPLTIDTPIQQLSLRDTANGLGNADFYLDTDGLYLYTTEVMNFSADAYNWRFGLGTTLLQLTGAGDLKTADYASQTTGWQISQDGNADVRYLFTNELRAKLFTADEEMVLKGSQMVTKSYSTLFEPFTCPADDGFGTATLWVRDDTLLPNARVFKNGDRVSVWYNSRTDGDSDGDTDFIIGECVGNVLSYADGTGAHEGAQSFTFTRYAAIEGAGSLTGGTVIPTDNIVLDFGNSGDGFAETSATDGPEGIYAPYFQIATFFNTPARANWTTRTRVGNLRGITGVKEYGILGGNYAASNGRYFRVSDQNFEIHGIDFTLWDGSSQTFVMRRNSGSPYFSLGNPAPTTYGSGAGIWMGKDSSTYKFRVGDLAGSQFLAYDGTSLTLRGTLNATDITTGTLTLSGTMSTIRGGLATAFMTGNGYWLSHNGGTPQMRVGTVATGNLASGLAWDGADLDIRARNFVVDSTGVSVKAVSSSQTWDAQKGLRWTGWTASGTSNVGITAYESTGAGLETENLYLIANPAGTVYAGQVVLQAWGANDASVSTLSLSGYTSLPSLDLIATAFTSTAYWRGPGGSSSLPAYTFALDPDTGMYNPSSGSLGFVLDTKPALFLQTGGHDNTEAYVPGRNSQSGTDFGSTVLVDRSYSDAGSTGVLPGMVTVVEADGGFDFIWPDNAGLLRTSSAPPEADGGPALTSGTVIGDQSSTRASKNILAEWADAPFSLQLVLATPVYRFTYKDGRYDGEEFTGIVTDDSPWFGKDHGRALNEINAIGHLVSAIKALEARIRALEER